MKNTIRNTQYAILITLILACLILPPTAQAEEYLQSNLRSGISLIVDGTPGVDFAEEYLYHDISIDDHKVIYVKSTTPITLSHNERNIFASELGRVPSGSPYFEDNGWYGLDGVPDTGDEHIIGTVGADRVASSGDEGDIFYRADRFEQFFPYEKVFDPAGDPPENEYINTPYIVPFTFEGLYYEPGVAVLGTFSSNGGTYDNSPRNTTERYHRGMLSPFGEEVHVLTYWDNDDGILPGLSGRGHLSDGNMTYFVVNPQAPVLSLSAPSGEEFYTTPLTSYHTPRILAQTTYLTGGVLIEMVNITNANPMFYRIDGGAVVPYTGPFNLSALSDGEHIMEFWIEGGPIKRRAFVLNPDYPSNAETHPSLLWDDEQELSRLRQKMTREPFLSGYNNFTNTLSSSYPGIEIPLPTRTEWRGIINKAYVPFHFMIPYYLEGSYTVNDNPNYATLAKKALLSLMNVDFIGSESIVDDFRPSTDIYSIPNSGHNSYVYLGLGYDLAINKFKLTDHPQGISPIEDYKIRDQLANVVHIMLKYRENKATKGETWSGWDGEVAGNMHWAHGEELVAYVISASMPSYNSPIYGTSGFNGSPAQYLWTPYPDQFLSWYEILTDPELPTPGHPNARSAARYNYIFGSYTQLLGYPRDADAVWDFPQEGIFWHGANGFAGATTLYELGEIDPGDLIAREMIKVPDGDLTDYSLTDVWTLEGRKLQTSWNRSFNLYTVAEPESGMFAVEMAGYESPFVANAALVHQIHKRKFGVELSPKITGYFETKFDRIAGNFNPYYLKRQGTSGDVYNYLGGGVYEYPLLGNSQWLAGGLPLLIYNPLMPAKVKDALPVLKNLAAEYSNVYYRKFYSNPLALIIFEDDEAKYNSQPTVLGDVNADSEISAFDAALAAHIAVDLEHADIKNPAAAEVSGDGEVTAYDAALIAQRAVGLIDRFPVEG